MAILNKKGHDYKSIAEFCRNGDLSQVKNFMNEGFHSEDGKNEAVFRILPNALMHDNIHIVDFLIVDCKFDIDYKCNIYGNNLLIHVSRYGRVPYIKHLIKEFNFDPYYKNNYGNSIFSYINTDEKKEIKQFIEENKNVYLKPAKYS
jgi:hypothetical protein